MSSKYFSQTENFLNIVLVHLAKRIKVSDTVGNVLEQGFQTQTDKRVTLRRI
jgi:hypothetical protein